MSSSSPEIVWTPQQVGPSGWYGFARVDPVGRESEPSVQVLEWIGPHEGHPGRWAPTPARYRVSTVTDLDGPLAIDLGRQWIMPAVDARAMAAFARTLVAADGSQLGGRVRRLVDRRRAMSGVVSVWVMPHDDPQVRWVVNDEDDMRVNYEELRADLGAEQAPVSFDVYCAGWTSLDMPRDLWEDGTREQTNAWIDRRLAPLTPAQFLAEVLANLRGKGEEATAQYLAGMAALVGPAEALRIVIDKQ